MAHDRSRCLPVKHVLFSKTGTRSFFGVRARLPAIRALGWGSAVELFWLPRNVACELLIV